MCFGCSAIEGTRVNALFSHWELRAAMFKIFWMLKVFFSPLFLSFNVGRRPAITANRSSKTPAWLVVGLHKYFGPIFYLFKTKILQLLLPITFSFQKLSTNVKSHDFWHVFWERCKRKCGCWELECLICPFIQAPLSQGLQRSLWFAGFGEFHAQAYG